MDKLLNLEEFAAQARQTEAAMRWLRHTGALPPAAKIGRRLVWREADVQAWIDKQFEQQAS